MFNYTEALEGLIRDPFEIDWSDRGSVAILEEVVDLTEDRISGLDP